MFAEAHFPRQLEKSNLDDYLESGWFRMGQTIFTTNFLYLNATLFSAIWLRVDLQHWQPEKKFSKLQKQNRNFHIQIQQGTITPEKEELYQRYKTGVSFSPSSSLTQLLYGEKGCNIFDTYEILIYDQEKLIAVGFFDLGELSAAGITSFYDPEYKKFSLGKFLIYSKMKYCKEIGLKWFYPGYFVPNCTPFDYKTEIGKENLSFLQFTSNNWIEFDHYSEQEHHLLAILEQKLTEMQLALEEISVHSCIKQYEFFEVNLYQNFEGANLFDYPLFLYCFEEKENTLNPVIVYDFKEEHFVLIQCVSIWTNPTPATNPNSYTQQLLRADRYLYTSPIAQELAYVLKRAVMTVE